MASGESAFNLCLQFKDPLPLERSRLSSRATQFTSNSPFEESMDDWKNPNSCLGEELSMKCTTIEARTKNVLKLPICYLVQAWRITEYLSKRNRDSKKELENQSAGSGDDTNSTTNKRFESGILWNASEIKAPTVTMNGALTFPDWVSVGSSPTNKAKRFGDRPDVIYKTILRSFKKYYLADFNEVTDYKRKKRRIANQAFLLDMTQEYVSAKFPECPFEDLRLFIAALVQPKLPQALESNSKLQELSRTVCEVLYRFSKSKMNDLLSYPQFTYILKFFLSKPDLIEFIGDKSSSPQAKQNLKSQIAFLAEQWNKVLTKNKSINFGEAKNQIFEDLQPRNAEKD